MSIPGLFNVLAPDWQFITKH